MKSAKPLFNPFLIMKNTKAKRTIADGSHGATFAQIESVEMFVQIGVMIKASTHRAKPRLMLGICLRVVSVNVPVIFFTRSFQLWSWFSSVLLTITLFSTRLFTNSSNIALRCKSS